MPGRGFVTQGDHRRRVERVATGEESLEVTFVHRVVAARASTKHHAPGVLADGAPFEAFANLPVDLELERSKASSLAAHAVDLADDLARAAIGLVRLGALAFGDVLGNRKAARWAGDGTLGNSMSAFRTVEQHAADHSRRASRALLTA
jgi:hypothetical protein